jgi:hypothetical protein
MRIKDLNDKVHEERGPIFLRLKKKHAYWSQHIAFWPLQGVHEKSFDGLELLQQKETIKILSTIGLLLFWSSKVFKDIFETVRVHFYALIH